jgi:hypothetical protein
LAFDSHRAEIQTEEDISIELENEENRKVVKKESLRVKTIKGNPGAVQMYDAKRLFCVKSEVLSDIISLFSSTFIPGDCNWISCTSSLCKTYLLFSKRYYLSHKYKDRLLVLEGIRKSSYGLGGNKSLFTDFYHTVLALEDLARFHALLCAMKKK